MQFKVILQLFFPHIDRVIDCDGKPFHKGIPVGGDVDGKHAMSEFRTGEETAVVEMIVSLVGTMVEHVQLHILIKHIHDASNREWFVKLEIEYSGVIRNIGIHTSFAINQSGHHQWHYGHEFCNFIGYHISFLL